MKLKYLATLTAIALLSLSFTTACSSPTVTTTPVSTSVTSKPDPCASKTKTVGNPLAQQLQGKPVVIDVYASWCPACKNIAPTVAQLKEKYEGKVEFVVLDVSDMSTTLATKATAQKLGLDKFLAENKKQTGSVAIVDPATGNILAQYQNNADIAAYTKVLDAALSKS